MDVRMRSESQEVNPSSKTVIELDIAGLENKMIINNVKQINKRLILLSLLLLTTASKPIPNNETIM